MALSKAFAIFYNVGRGAPLGLYAVGERWVPDPHLYWPQALFERVEARDHQGYKAGVAPLSPGRITMVMLDSDPGSAAMFSVVD